jgi:uncharacterized protein (TIGR02246 family)
MKNRLYGWLVCTALSLGFLSPGVAQTGPVRSQVEKLNAAWDAAFNKGDAAALARLYDDRAVVSPGNGKVITGRAEIEKLFKSFIDAGVHHHRIEIITTGGSGDTAYEVARWSAQLPEKDGKKGSLGGILTSVFTRSGDGQWRAVSHVWNAASE